MAMVMAALMLGSILASLDETVIATALPTIAGDLHGLNHLSWVVTAYLLTVTISAPLYGKLGDLYGRKRLFQWAIIIFLLGSVLSGVSTTMIQLIIFRALQGIGGGGLMVGAQAIVADVVSPRDRGRYQGYLGAEYGLASIIGPLIGGFFTEKLNWRWVFYVNIPIGLAALVAVTLALHLPAHHRRHRIDYWGTATLAVCAASLILMCTWGGVEYPWLSPQIAVLAIIGLATAGAFIRVELRAAEPVLPPSLFRSSVFSLTNVVGFILGFAMFGSVIYLPLFLQTVTGSSATVSGLQLLPMVAGWLVTSVLTGHLMSRWGRYKVFPILGMGTTGAGLYLLSLMNAETTLLQAAWYLFVFGLGLGSVMQVLVVAVQNAVPHRHVGTATSSAAFFRQIGGTFGVAAFGAIFTAQLTRNLPKYVPYDALDAVGSTSVDLSPDRLADLPEDVHQGVVAAFAESLDIVFLAGVPFAALAFVLCFFLREMPLRTTLPDSG